MEKRIPVIAVFDIGKTNKKLLVFDADYNVLKEEVTCFDEIADDDGFACENIDALAAWILWEFEQLKRSEKFQLKAVNFSTYGASLVYVNHKGERVGYLYNYLKPYPRELMDRFLASKGGIARFAEDTSSPVMGHLNAGLQLYWLKHHKAELFNNVATALHLPQYLSFLITGQRRAELTSLGCHSVMWDFYKMNYHSWLQEEGLHTRLARVTKGSEVVRCSNEFTGEEIWVGTGLHDSSAAVNPYLIRFTDPFMIISTGTWVICMNPFNSELPGSKELEKGCLSYLTYQGAPIKTTMLFAGNDHDQQVKRITQYFAINEAYLKSTVYNAGIIEQLRNKEMLRDLKSAEAGPETTTTPCRFHSRDLSSFDSPEQAYHQLLIDLVIQQKASADMVLQNSEIDNIYVDGGFCKNKIYMQLLANAFSTKNVFGTSMTQGTALGAALAIHNSWNKGQLPESLISLKRWIADQDSLVTR
ncbi:FGGY-family carbohydrate kinase [Niabella sp. CJ426]|uniref:FGGY-family carbohydrate kinase n=1 Tax=Niabella sp. CJ426 TaxID=3393740 RepID=UPI003CFC90A9